MWVQTSLTELFVLFGFQQLGLAKEGFWCVFIFVIRECAAFTGIIWGLITMTGADVEAEVDPL